MKPSLAPEKKKNPNLSIKTALAILVFAFTAFFYGNAKTNHNACGSYATTYIMHDTTWSDSPPPYFQGGNIFITAGHTLTLNNGIILWFHENAQILNSDSPTAAAHLVINNAYLYGCNGPLTEQQWGGIHINGVPDAHGHYSEYDSTTLGMNSAQSSVQVTNGVFQDADSGIVVTNHAILQINSANFTNCFVGTAVIDSMPDYNYTKVLAQISSSGTVVACQSYIHTGGYDTRTIVSSVGSDSLNTYKAVYLYGTQYFEIYGCFFECDYTIGQMPGHQRPTGIEALNASFSCHSSNGTEDPSSGCVVYSGSPQPNIFTGLTYGIHAQGSAQNSYTMHLDDNQFVQCFTAIYVLEGTHHVIHGNQIRFNDSSAYWLASDSNTYNNEVWLQLANNFIFYGNKITQDKQHTAFLYLDNSGTDKKNITSNTFINSTRRPQSSMSGEYGLYFSGDNRNQMVTCNYFRNHLYSIYADTTSLLTPFGSVPNEGVGNTFRPTTGNAYWVYNASHADTIWYNTDTICITMLSHENYPYVSGSCPMHDSCADIESCKSWGRLGVFPLNFIMDRTVEVYPNPTDDHLIFDFSNIGENVEGTRIEIFNILGQAVTKQSIGYGTMKSEISTASYSEGMYIYRISQGENLEKTGKFEVKH